MKTTSVAKLIIVFSLGMVAFIMSDALSDRRDDDSRHERKKCEENCVNNHQNCANIAYGVNNAFQRALAIAYCTSENDKCMQSCSTDKRDKHRDRDRGERNKH